jgi:hypothetical protein
LSILRSCTPLPVDSAFPIFIAFSKTQIFNYYSTVSNSSSDAYWVSSWVQLDSGGDVAKILCEWDTKNLSPLKKTMEQAKNMFPDFPTEGSRPIMNCEVVSKSGKNCCSRKKAPIDIGAFLKRIPKKQWLPENDPRRTHFDFYIILERPLILNELLKRKNILIKLEV